MWCVYVGETDFVNMNPESPDSQTQHHACGCMVTANHTARCPIHDPFEDEPGEPESGELMIPLGEVPEWVSRMDEIERILKR